MGANTSEHAITVTFLHPCIPASSFVYPEQEDVMDVDLSDILTSVNATTATGRRYSLSRKAMQEASAGDVNVVWILYSLKVCGWVL